MTTKNRLTVAEAAAAMGKHRVTIRRMLAAGTLPTVREGGRVFIPTAAVESAVARACAHCGETFTPGRYATRGRYCSPACRWASAYAARKAAHPATRAPGRPPKELAKRSGGRRAVPERLRAALEATRQTPTA
jgi:excisionase family DNA binding protein